MTAAKNVIPLVNSEALADAFLELECDIRDVVKLLPRSPRRYWKMSTAPMTSKPASLCATQSTMRAMRRTIWRAPITTCTKRLNSRNDRAGAGPATARPAASRLKGELIT
jgi:hypothetical protein